MASLEMLPVEIQVEILKQFTTFTHVHSLRKTRKRLHVVCCEYWTPIRDRVDESRALKCWLNLIRSPCMSSADEALHLPLSLNHTPVDIAALIRALVPLSDASTLTVSALLSFPSLTHLLHLRLCVHAGSCSSYSI